MYAIYVRVSTEEQAKSGYSLKNQIAVCRDRLIKLGLAPIQEYIDDGYSGEFLDRPALDRLREDIQNKIIKGVMMYDPDRMGRNLTNQLLLSDEIEKAGAKLYFVTGDYDASPEGRLFFSMKGAVSAFEKAKIRQRTLGGKKTKAKAGKIVINTKPFGFSWDDQNQTYTISEEQAKIVRMIYSLCIDKRLGTPAITRELRNRGILNQYNRPFNHMHVYRILTKELYCGVAYSGQISTTKTGQYTKQTVNRPKDEWIPIPIPAIIPREDWEKAQRIIKQNKSALNKNCKRSYLLKGIVKCGVCGMGLVASQHKKVSVTHYYRCVTKSSNQYQGSKFKCTNRYIPVDDLEEAVWQAFIDMANGSYEMEDFLRSDTIIDRSAEINDILQRQEEIRKKQSDVMKWYRSNLIDSEMAEAELLAANKELAATTITLEQLQAAQSKINKPTKELSMQDIINATTFEQKRNILLNAEIDIYVSRMARDFEFWFKYR